MLSFTPPERLTDAEGRPYFLWDCARALGWRDTDTRTLVAFRDWLLQRLTAAAAPEWTRVSPIQPGGPQCSTRSVPTC